MKIRKLVLALFVLSFICLPVLAQQDIISAVPDDAFGFVATKNLQASYDKLMLFLAAIGAPGPAENHLLAIKEHLGAVDLNGPAAAILLDPEKFPDEPVALIFSAPNPRAVLQAHQDAAGDRDVNLPAGVVAGADGYMGVKKGFLVFAPGPEQTAAVMASPASPKVVPAATEALGEGQIVLAGDMKRSAPWMIKKLQELRDQALAGMDSAHAAMQAHTGEPPDMQAAQLSKDMISLYVDFIQTFLQQSDKLTVVLDADAQRAVLTKRLLFKADSPASAFMNLQMLQAVPSYNALPGGPFLMAGGVNIAPKNVKDLADGIIGRITGLPSFKGSLSDQMIQRMTTEMRDMYVQASGTAFTFNLGSPATGLFNGVVRYDVADAGQFRKLIGDMYSPEGSASAWAELSKMPVKYVFAKAADTHTEVPIDTVQMQMVPPADDAAANPMMAQQMQMMPMMFGPDMTFRLASPNNKQVLFTMGGGRERMEQAINVAKGIGRSLAEQAVLKQAAASLPAKRFAEAHLDISQLIPMMGMMMMGGPGAMPPPAPAEQTAPISFAFSAEPNSIRMDMVVPAASIKAFTEAAAGAAGGPPPDFEDDDFEWEDEDLDEDDDF